MSALLRLAARHAVPRLAAAVLGSALALAGTAAAAQTVKLSTSLGDIAIKLDAVKAPRTVQNFVSYVEAGHYDGTVFHRVMPGFMIQGGGFSAQLEQKPTRAPIPLESRNGLSNLRGTIAMARTSAPDSATAQFFINLQDNQRLDYSARIDETGAMGRKGDIIESPGYAVFGQVVEGMDVVDRIARVPTAPRGPHEAVPLSPVIIKRAYVEK